VNILDKVGVTCMMVTHDQEEAIPWPGRDRGDDEGEIVQIGTPHEVYEYPNSRFTAEFIGSTNLFEGTVVEDERITCSWSRRNCPSRLYVEPRIYGSARMPVTNLRGVPSASR